MKTTHKLVIGVLCALALLLVAVLAVLMDSRSADPVLDIIPTASTAASEGTTGTQDTQPSQGAATTPTQPATPTQPVIPTQPVSDPVAPPQDLPPSVVIPPQEDPSTGQPTQITFPCQVPGYGLVIEKLAPYDGMFVEDGTNSQVQDVAMLLVHNKGDYPVEYTSIQITSGEQTLQFDISGLPVGERLVVQEKTGKTITEVSAESATALVVQRADMEMSQQAVRVTDNGDNTLTVENLTGKTIPTVRIFYKYYMEEEGLFIGGIAFTVRISGLSAGTKTTIQPAHFTSQSSRVVMVLTYDSEV